MPNPLTSVFRPVLPPPRVLPLRQRSDVIHRVLKRRLETVLPAAMRESGFDMWLVICQEDNWDPIHDTFCPMDPWRPILQMLVFFDRGPQQGVERINLSMTNMQGLYDTPWQGKNHPEQWAMLRQIVEQRDPKRIGINIGRVQWVAGGLTHNLYRQLVETLPPRYAERLDSAEPMVVHWASVLSDDEIELYEHVADVAKSLIAECYSRAVIVPGVTTLDDLVWHYWQRASDLGLPVSFRPFFYRYRSDAAAAQFGPDDPVLRAGDFVRCDVGIRYLRLCSDHQQWAYLLRPGEVDAPPFAHELLAEAHRLQDIFMSEFRGGLTGNQLLANILARAAGKHPWPEGLFAFARPVPAPARSADRAAVGTGALRRPRRRRAARKHRLHDGAFRREERARMGQRELPPGRRGGRAIFRRPLSPHPRAAASVLSLLMRLGREDDRRVGYASA